MNGKAKGSAFERTICKALSLWVSGGKHHDLFWRSAMSGGRSTLAHRRGEANRQGGDICAVAPEGHSLTQDFYIECKHVRNLSIDSFIIKNTGPLATYWRKAQREAARHGRRPMLIARQNRMPIIVVMPPGPVHPTPVVWSSTYRITLFDEMVRNHYDVKF